MSSNITFQKKTLALAIGSVIAGHAPNAGAQEEGAEKGVLEEIVVTATRRESSVLDIPYNVSAVSGDEIVGQNIVDATDLMRLIPGVSVVDRGYRNSGMVNSMIIRGVNVDNGVNGDVGLSSVAPVASCSRRCQSSRRSRRGRDAASEQIARLNGLGVVVAT